MRGYDRFLIYWTATRTGFRAGEMRYPTPACLVGNSLCLDGKHTKNGEDAIQPIPDDLAASLREYVKDKPVNEPIWDSWWWERGALMIRMDLAAAGIPVRTPVGEVDFHSLRHTYSELVKRAGADPKTRRILNRHSSDSMVMVYTHTDDADIRQVVDRLSMQRVSVDDFLAEKRQEIERDLFEETIVGTDAHGRTVIARRAKDDEQLHYLHDEATAGNALLFLPASPLALGGSVQDLFKSFLQIDATKALISCPAGTSAGGCDDTGSGAG